MSSGCGDRRGAYVAIRAKSDRKARSPSAPSQRLYWQYFSPDQIYWSPRYGGGGGKPEDISTLSRFLQGILERGIMVYFALSYSQRNVSKSIRVVSKSIRVVLDRIWRYLPISGLHTWMIHCIINAGWTLYSMHQESWSLGMAGIRSAPVTHTLRQCE